MSEIDFIRSKLTYDPATGVIRSKLTGKSLGSLNYKGYVVVMVGAGTQWKTYRAHRLAFALMLGRWPHDQVDHVNHDKADNRWDNLRDATNGQNNGNRKLLRNNTSGFRGIVWRKKDRAWRAILKVEGKKISLGQFKSKERAAAVYARAAQQHFGDFYYHDLIG